MIRWVTCFIILLTAATLQAQKDSVRKYLDAQLNFTTKKNFVYAAMAVKENDKWLLYAVYPDTSVLLKIHYKDAGLTVKDGSYELFHPKGIPAQKGAYSNNKANGWWQSWHANGKPKNEGRIVNGHFSGVWKYWYEDGKPMTEETYAYSDSLAGAAAHQSTPSYKAEKILDEEAPEGKLQGPSTTWYRNGNKESSVNYQNDSLAGVCTWFGENGFMSSKETYANGKVIDLACYDTAGNYTGATCSILKLPLLIHPVFDALDFIEFELHKEKHRNIAEGDAEIRFTVTKKGTVENLVIVQSPDEDLSKLITKAIASMPAWSPAVVHNRAVDYPVQLTIPYYRN